MKSKYRTLLLLLLLCMMPRVPVSAHGDDSLRVLQKELRAAEERLSDLRSDAKAVRRLALADSLESELSRSVVRVAALTRRADSLRAVLQAGHARLSRADEVSSRLSSALHQRYSPLLLLPLSAPCADSVAVAVQHCELLSQASPNLSRLSAALRAREHRADVFSRCAVPETLVSADSLQRLSSALAALTGLSDSERPEVEERRAALQAYGEALQATARFVGSVYADADLSENRRAGFHKESARDLSEQIKRSDTPLGAAYAACSRTTQGVPVVHRALAAYLREVTGGIPTATERKLLPEAAGMTSSDTSN